MDIADVMLQENPNKGGKYGSGTESGFAAGFLK